jgi:hypothetical protein
MAVAKGLPAVDNTTNSRLINHYGRFHSLLVHRLHLMIGKPKGSIDKTAVKIRYPVSFCDPFILTVSSQEVKK